MFIDFRLVCSFYACILLHLKNVRNTVVRCDGLTVCCSILANLNSCIRCVINFPTELSVQCIYILARSSSTRLRSVWSGLAWLGLRSSILTFNFDESELCVKVYYGPPKCCSQARLQFIWLAIGHCLK